MDLTVIDKSPAAADTIRITLASRDGGTLPAFTPGAHLELFFAGFARQYSLTSSPRDLRAYEICVLRAEPSRGGSAYLHDRLLVGDPVRGAGPFNALPLRLDASYTVFIAGGIGITPFLSMMDALERSSKPFQLHYAARHSNRFLRVPEYPGRTRHYVGADGGRTMAIDAILAPLPADADVYVCGPRGLIEDVRASAAARGWPNERIHIESFGTGVRSTDAPVTVHLALSRLSIEVPPGTTVLDALLSHGVWAPYECRRGECASCMTEVLSGEPDHRDVCLTVEQRRHTMCPCVSRARTSALTLNL